MNSGNWRIIRLNLKGRRRTTINESHSRKAALKSSLNPEVKCTMATLCKAEFDFFWADSGKVDRYRGVARNNYFGGGGGGL